MSADKSSNATDTHGAATPPGAASGSPATVLRGRGPELILIVLAVLITWPVAAGVPPASGDHPVHLGRAAAQLDALTHLQLRTWWAGWGLGTPVGDLYPPLADALVVTFKLLSLGLLPLERCYAMAVLVGFALPAWVLPSVARRLELSSIAGLIAGALYLLDVGVGREGGWIYTMWMGVWPQALATGLQWLALAHLLRAAASPDGPLHQTIARAGGLLALAILAHPMTLPVLGLWLPVVALVGLARRRLVAAVVAGLASVGLAVLLAAFWLFPMLSLRGWMASYGWLFRSWAQMVEPIVEHLAVTTNLPAAVGAMSLLGLTLVLVRGRAAQRGAALATATVWLAAGADWVWWIRPDRLSEAFTHLQYQRFLIAAKPGVFLLAGASLTLLAPRVSSLRGRAAPATVASAATRVALVLAGTMWIATDVASHAGRFKVGDIPRQAVRTNEDFRAHREEVLTWLDEYAEQLGRPVRVVFDDGRNVHWLMDAPAGREVRVWKVGFTPGDNFVHKPEVRTPEVLGLFGPDVVVRRGKPRRGLGKQLARFGSIRVYEAAVSARPVAWLDGVGSVEVIAHEVDALTVEVRDTAGPTRLTFGVPGFGRWELRRDGEPVPWEEVPIVGQHPSLSAEARSAGAFRGGKALGDDGSEPTLISDAAAIDGTYTLVYQRWRAADVLGLLASLLALWSLRQARRGRGPLLVMARMATWSHARAVLSTLGLVALLLAAHRWWSARAEESDRASFKLRTSMLPSNHPLTPGLLKTEMTIGPAVLVPGGAPGSWSRRWSVEIAPATLRGWMAVEDDWVKGASNGRHTFSLHARGEGDADDVEVWRERLPHVQGRHPFTVDLAVYEGQRIELELRVSSTGRRPPPAGIELIGLP